MNPDHHLPARDAGRFRTTHWSAVLLSAQSQVPGAQKALAELCQIYWYPLYGFVRRRGYGPDEAQDLTQGFFLHLLQNRALARISPLKGKFRSFLMASLQNFLSGESDRVRSIKRGGNIDFVPFEVEAAEERYQHEPLDCLTAEKIFDARWAMTLMEGAMSRLCAEYAEQGKAATLEALKPFLDPLGGLGPPPYEQAAESLQVSVGSVKTLIHRARKQYRSLLREEVACTVSAPAEVDEEIHALCEALIATEGRLDP